MNSYVHVSSQSVSKGTNRHPNWIFCGIAAMLAIFLVSSLCLADSPTTVSYQGELKKAGVLFTGSANFKFAIVSAGTPDTTLWSNDGSSVNGSEPATALTLQVAAGIFSVLLGAPPMVPITGNALDQATGAVSLKVWVDTGSNPLAAFELLPGMPVSSSPFSLFDNDWKRGSCNGPVMYPKHITDRVGIGNTCPDPGTRLHVSGITVIGATGGNYSLGPAGSRVTSAVPGGAWILGTQGNTPANPALAFGGGQDGTPDGGGGNGIFRPLANTMGFAVQSTEVMRISSAGDLHFRSLDGIVLHDTNNGRCYQIKVTNGVVGATEVPCVLN